MNTIALGIALMIIFVFALSFMVSGPDCVYYSLKYHMGDQTLIELVNASLACE